MRILTSFSTSLLLAFSLIPPNVNGEPNDVHVSLSAPKDHFLLGEPVALDVTVANQAQNAFKVHLVYPRVFEHGCILFSCDSKKYFHKYDKEFNGYTMTLMPVRILEPQKPWVYRVDLLSTLDEPEIDPRQNPNLPRLYHLVFDRPGVHFVKVVFPFHEEGFEQVNIESKPIRIVIRQPEGDDLKVWKKIQTKECQFFLQIGHKSELEPFGYISPMAKETASQLADILSDFPNSGYRDSIHRVLRNYYAKGSFSPQDREKYRRVLGLSKEVEAFFPNDEQLDLDAVLQPHSGTTLETTLKTISEQHQVRLRASRSIRSKPCKPREGLVNLRQLMQALAKEFNGTWMTNTFEYTLYSEEDICKLYD